jgi:hypothetical protein
MTNYIKYPSTKHLPWSPGLTNDDTLMPDVDCFVGKNIVITEKMDGENTSLYSDHIHARSLDGRHHPSRNWVKTLWGNISYMIPEGWRICGENLYAKHSVGYDDLETYFMVFSVWNGNNECLSWEDTVEFCGRLSLKTVPVIHKGLWEENIVINIWKDEYNSVKEGYVVRNAASFHFNDFEKNLAKYVRKNHVQTDQHWMHSEIVPNILKKVD